MSVTREVTGFSTLKGKATAAAIGAVLITGAAVAIATSGSDRLTETTLPAGTQFVAALGSSISTQSAETGTPVRLETAEPVRLANGLVVPEGSVIRGEVTHVKGGGRIAGAPELTLRFREVSILGRSYPIAAQPFRLRGRDDATQSAAMIGGGAVLGGVVGAVTGAGTIEGAAVGAVLGTGAAVVTKGDQIELPSGQRIRVRLSEPVVVMLPEAQPEEVARQP